MKKQFQKERSEYLPEFRRLGKEYQNNPTEEILNEILAMKMLQDNNLLSFNDLGGHIKQGTIRELRSAFNVQKNASKNLKKLSRSIRSMGSERRVRNQRVFPEKLRVAS